MIKRIAEQLGVSRESVRRTHQTWTITLRKCHEPKCIVFDKYGAKGVTVCDRWRESFQAFVDDMGLRPSPAHSIDRINNDRGYEPDNCRWATAVEQQQNRTNNNLVEYEGERICIAELERRVGMPPGSVANRLRIGWTLERALSTPVRPRRRSGRTIEHKGRPWTVSELAEVSKVERDTLRWRLKSGWPLLRAMLSPSGFPAPHRLLRVKPLL